MTTRFYIDQFFTSRKVRTYSKEKIIGIYFSPRAIELMEWAKQEIQFRQIDQLIMD